MTPTLRPALLAMLVSAGACTGSYSGPDGSVGGSVSTITVALASEPIRGLDSAVLYVSGVFVRAGADATGERFTVASTQNSVNLHDVDAGATDSLGAVTVPTGTYTQVFIEIDSMRLRLSPGTTFSDGTRLRTIVPPAAESTGTRVRFVAGFPALSRQTSLLVAINVTSSLTYTGSAAAPTGVTLAPVLRGLTASARGSISGTVTPASAKARVVAVIGVDTVWTVRADTATGAYSLRYLSPATYTVAAAGTGLVTQKPVPVRAGQDTTGVALP